MERRKFLGSCAAASGALAFPDLSAWAHTAPRLYEKARLVDSTGAALRVRTLRAETNYVFHFPFAGTPCFLLNLNRPIDASAGGNGKSGHRQ